MKNFNIIYYPDYRLRKKSIIVKSIDLTIKNICNQMIILMNLNEGIGLAANQIGILQRIIILKQKEKNLILINPVILKKEKNFVMILEGCLSIKDFFFQIMRKKKVNLYYFNLNLLKIKKKMIKLDAVCVQHEIDHINGILFIDHLNVLNFISFLNFFLKKDINLIC